MPPVLDTARARVQGRLDESGSYKRWVLLTALTGMFATTFPVTILTASIKPIAQDFDADVSLVAWVVAGPLLAGAVALPILGKLGDLYGHRRVFLTGFTLSTIVTAFTVFAWDPYSLIGLRGLAVVVGAATGPSSMALINSVHSPTERAKVMSWWSTTAAGAPAMGVLIGAPLIDSVGWRPTFALQAGLSVVPVLAATLVLRETAPKRDVGFDLVGAVAMALGAGGVMLTFNQLPERGIDGVVTTSAVVGVLGLVAFVVAQRRVRFPLLPLEFFRRRNFTAAMLGSLLSGGAYMGGFVLAPILLNERFGYSFAAAALIMLLRTISFSTSSPVWGSLASRIGERPVVIVGTVLIAAAMALLGIGASTGILTIVLVGLLAQGIGNGAAQPMLTATLANSVDESDLGIASAAQRMMFQVGSALGITIMTSVYGDTGRSSDFLVAYLVGAGLATAAIGFAVIIRSTARTPEAADSADSGDVRTGGDGGVDVEDIDAVPTATSVPGSAVDPHLVEQVAEPAAAR